MDEGKRITQKQHNCKKLLLWAPVWSVPACNAHHCNSQGNSALEEDTGVLEAEVTEVVATEVVATEVVVLEAGVTGLLDKRVELVSAGWRSKE